MSGAATQQQPAPATGMQRIPLPLESYQHQSLPLTAKRLLNMMAEQEPADARTNAALIPTPGLVEWLSVGTGPIRAINSDFPGYIYVVSGSEFYRITFSPDSVGIVTDLGPVGVPAGPLDYLLFVSIAVGPIGAVACVPPNAFTCTHTGTANQLGGTFPGDASSVAYYNGYFVFTKQVDSQEFFISKLEDPTDYDALDYASASEAFPNIITKVLTLGPNLWFVGHAGIEIWYDAGSSGLETTSGTSFFPLRRLAGGVIQQGVATPRATAIGDGSLFWVTGNGIVLRTIGYQPQRVSTHAIEDLLRTYGTSNIASCLTYSQNGHIFFVVNVGPRTLVYDCATKLWHERSSYADGSGRWRIDHSTMNTGDPILGDCDNGSLYFANPIVGTDAGATIFRNFECPPLWADTRRAFMSRVEIEMEVGDPRLATDGEVILEWSDDGGWTFTQSRIMSAGPAGQRRKRVFTTRLGSFRQRVFRVTGYGFMTVYAIDADITAGVS